MSEADNLQRWEYKPQPKEAASYASDIPGITKIAEEVLERSQAIEILEGNQTFRGNCLYLTDNYNTRIFISRVNRGDQDSYWVKWTITQDPIDDEQQTIEYRWTSTEPYEAIVLNTTKHFGDSGKTDKEELNHKDNFSPEDMIRLTKLFKAAGNMKRVRVASV